MTYTVEVQQVNERVCRVDVAFPDGQTFSTTAIGTPQQARAYAERVWIPRDLLRLHPELREDGGA